MTSSLAAGLSLRGIFGDGDYDGFDGRLALGLPLGDYLAIGVAGRYLSVESTQIVEGEETDVEVAQGFSMDAAFRVTPVEYLHLAALAYNIIDYESAVAPILLGGGASFQVDSLIVGGDFLADMTSFDHTTYRAGGGLELLVAGAVPLRAGYAYDTGRESHTVSAGLGYVVAEAGFDITMRRQVAGGDETELFAAVRYFVQ
jgi:hypothetical protein